MRDVQQLIQNTERELLNKGIVAVSPDNLSLSIGSRDLIIRRKRYLDQMAYKIGRNGLEAGSSLSLADSTALADGKAALWLFLDEYRRVMEATANVMLEWNKKLKRKPIKPTRIYAIKENISLIDAQCLIPLLHWHVERGIRTGVVRFESLPKELQQGIVVIPDKSCVFIPGLETGEPCPKYDYNNLQKSKNILEAFESIIIQNGIVVDNVYDLNNIAKEMGLNHYEEKDCERICLFGFTSRLGKRYPVLINSKLCWLRPSSYLLFLSLIEARLSEPLGDGRVSILDINIFNKSPLTKSGEPRVYKLIYYLRDDLDEYRDLIRCDNKEVSLKIPYSFITMFCTKLPQYLDQ